MRFQDFILKISKVNLIYLEVNFIEDFISLFRITKTLNYPIEKKGKIEGFLIYTISPITLSKIYLKNNFYYFFYFLTRSLLNKKLFIKFIKFFSWVLSKSFKKRKELS